MLNLPARSPRGSARSSRRTALRLPGLLLGFPGTPGRYVIHIAVGLLGLVTVLYASGLTPQGLGLRSGASLRAESQPLVRALPTGAVSAADPAPTPEPTPQPPAAVVAEKPPIA